MRTRETALVAIMLGMVGLASAYRLYEFETKPFDTAAFCGLDNLEGVHGQLRS